LIASLREIVAVVLRSRGSVEVRKLASVVDEDFGQIHDVNNPPEKE
jgi:hypothetical protein